jgi:hypothetical protein
MLRILWRTLRNESFLAIIRACLAAMAAAGCDILKRDSDQHSAFAELSDNRPAAQADDG